ncbi:MAG TPA: hypothetical protein VM123_16200 [archaeon]|nr:hypothetical protein [archaeon]
MSKNFSRRRFMEKSLAISTGIAAGLSLEQQALAGKLNASPSPPETKETSKGLQKGKIGHVEISRIICGGNLFDGFAASRDLIYVGSLMRNYFNQEKIMDTLEICEENGINTAIMLCWPHIIEVLNRYRKERGSKIQWIAQSHNPLGQLNCVKMAVDNGAVGFFIQGENGDTFVEEGRLDYIAKIVSLSKQNGLITGVGSHTLNVPKTLEKEGIEVDFYFKTFNNVNFSCPESPEEIASYMKSVAKPWIAFKVLGAGVIQPQEGFELAFRSGADFINVGMFDFQVVQDVGLVKNILAGGIQRERPWRA